MVDKVQIVSGSNGHSAASSLAQFLVRLVQGLVDKDEGIDDGLPVSQRQG